MKVFRLEQITYRTPKELDGSYSTWVGLAGVYGSVRSAEAVIRAIVAKNEEPQRVGFWLFENTVDGGFVGPFESICRHDSVQAYLADGCLLGKSLCDEACVKEFAGRDPKTLKLKPGDVAFCVGANHARPILIQKTPLDKAYWRRVKANVEKRYGEEAKPGWDYSDDCYMAYLCNGSHDHPMVWQVFPAWAPFQNERECGWRGRRSVMTIWILPMSLNIIAQRQALRDPERGAERWLKAV